MTEAENDQLVAERQSLKLDHNHSNIYMTQEEKEMIRTMKQCNIPYKNYSFSSCVHER
jgi:hypothetical protein